MGHASATTYDEVLQLKGELHCEPPNANLHIFAGRLEIAPVLQSEGPHSALQRGFVCASGALCRCA